MGSLDVVFSVLYASMFGRAHLGSILGLVNTLVYIAIGASPPIFALARQAGGRGGGEQASGSVGPSDGSDHGGGSFDLVLWALVTWMPLPALGVALAPLPRPSPSGRAATAPATHAARLGARATCEISAATAADAVVDGDALAAIIEDEMQRLDRPGLESQRPHP